MLVSKMLEAKPKNFVETISERETLGDVVARLAERKIGAIVVTGKDGGVAGIISERDIVRQMAAKGAECLTSAVADTMTRKVVSCAPTDRADEILTKMTEGRFRHMPVIDGAELVGILSIGDVVKAKIEMIEAENEAMEGMIRGF